MKKQTEKIEFEVVGDCVHISQPNPLFEEDYPIVVPADQIPQLIEWLRQAQIEIQGTRTKP